MGAVLKDQLTMVHSRRLFPSELILYEALSAQSVAGWFMFTLAEEIVLILLILRFYT